MKKNHRTVDPEEIIKRTMEEAWERSGEPQLRDVLKREYDEAQKRPRNEALEKWGPMIDDMIQRDLERERRIKQPKRGGPDMDME